MYKELDPLLHAQLRLAIMSILIGTDEADFVFIREKTGASAGNLSVQLDKLKEAGYLKIRKSFRGKVPCTSCKITSLGIDAFEKYVRTLQEYIKPGQS